MQRGTLIFVALLALFLAAWGVYAAVAYFRGGSPPKDPDEPNNPTKPNNGNGNNGGNNSNGNGNNSGGNNGNGGCPDVTKNVLPACELERRQDEGDRSYCPRGVCAEGLVAVPDTKTAYTICIPEGKGVEEVCP